MRKELALFLRNNQDVFTWSYEDMPRISPSVMVRKLNVSPSFPSVRQKKKVFAQKRDKAIAEEVCKLLEVDFIKEVYYPKWLVGQYSDGKKGEWQMEVVCRLH